MINVAVVLHEVGGIRACSLEGGLRFIALGGGVTQWVDRGYVSATATVLNLVSPSRSTMADGWVAKGGRGKGGGEDLCTRLFARRPGRLCLLSCYVGELC